MQNIFCLPYHFAKSICKKRQPLLTWLLVFLFLNSGAQSVTLNLQNANIEKAFAEITRQTEFTFVYTRAQVKNTPLISIQVSSVPLKLALDQCFANQALRYQIEGKQIIVQNKLVTSRVDREPETEIIDISGRVLNTEGKSLAGATIFVKGGAIATKSNESGFYKLSGIPLNAVVAVSYIGYLNQEINITHSGYFEIHLVPAEGILDETMVIAYGKSSRRFSTGTVSSVKSGQIEKIPTTEPLTALAGRVSGLQITQYSGVPGSLIRVRLRGQNSLANGNDPLYIVDGVPYPSQSFSGIFLGGGGVVSNPLNTLNTNDIESIEILKDADATAIYGSRAANGVILITTKKGVSGKPRFDVQVYAGGGSITRKLKLLNTPEYVAMRREAFRNDNTTPTTANARDLLLWDTTRYTDWQEKLIGKTMSVQNATASYSAGTKNTLLRLAGGFNRETTVFPGNFDLKKFFASLNFSQTSDNNRFSLSGSTEFNATRSKMPTQDLTTQVILPPNAPAIYDSTGKLNWENSTWTNPFSALEQVFKFNSDNLNSNLKISYNIISGLNLSVHSGITHVRSKDHAITPSKYYDPVYNLKGQARFGNTSLYNFIVEPQLTYNFNVKETNLDWLLGLTLQDSKQKGLYQAGTGYTNDEMLGSLKAAATVLTVDETDIKYRYAGLYARLNSNIKKRYLGTLTFRRDGSSRYGPASRFSNFGSLGLGWIFSEEPWLHLSALSYGKIKFSAGFTGNDQIGDYKYLDLYAPTQYTYLGSTTYSPQQLFNPDFSWEQVKKFETGLELGFFSDRLYLSVNYYHNITTNQLTSYPLPNMTGFSGILKNIPATIRNSGLEAELNGTIINQGKIKWDSRFNITFPSNRLVAYEDLKNSSYASRYVVGQSLFIAKKYQLEGVDPASGIYLYTDFDKDGRISSPNDQQKIIFTGQQYFGGFENMLSYGRFTISALLQFVKQKHGENYLNNISGRPGFLSNQPVWIMNRWQNPGDKTNIQRFANSNAPVNSAYSMYRQSNAAYSDASFMRFRNVYLSVTILSQNSKYAIQELELFMQGHNLFTITNYKGLDPETKSPLPPIRMGTFGFKIIL